MSISHPFDMELGVSYYPDYVSDFLAAEIPPVTSSESQTSKKIFRAPEIQQEDIQRRIRADLDAMKELGLTIIRMGEFSWSSVEPEPGKYLPELFLFTLDEALRRSIKVIFCTPTATPPRWLVQKHPEILPVDREGRSIGAGSRRQYNLASAVYREHARRIAQYYGQTFGIHDAVVGFQIDNEFGCHGSAFQFNSEIRLEFQSWLRKRYHSIEDLNQLWFNSFWSARFKDFDEINLPDHTYTDNNPHLELEYRRFISQITADFQRMQILEIQKSCGKWCTHNFMSLFTDLDHWKLSQELDYAGFDHYQMKPFPDAADSLWQFYLMRSLRPERSFLLLEQQPLQVNWQSINRRLPYPWLFLWTMQAFFQGAGAVLYFSWQRFRGGAERMHDGIISHEGLDFDNWQKKVIRSINSIKSDLRARYQALGSGADANVHGDPADDAEVNAAGYHDGNGPSADSSGKASYNPEAIIFLDYDSLWAHEICAQSQDYKLLEVVRRIGLLLNEMGLNFAFCNDPDSVPSSFESSLWIFPGTNFIEDVCSVACQNFQQQGGIIISLPTTGSMDSLGRMMPAPLRFMDPGLRMADFGALGPEERESIQAGDLTLHGNLWAESIEIAASESLSFGSSRSGKAQEISESGRAGVARSQNSGAGNAASVSPKINDRVEKDPLVLGQFRGGLYDGSPAILGKQNGGGGWIHLATVPELIDHDSLKQWSQVLIRALDELRWSGWEQITHRVQAPSVPSEPAQSEKEHVPGSPFPSGTTNGASLNPALKEAPKPSEDPASRTHEVGLLAIPDILPFPGCTAYLNPTDQAIRILDFGPNTFSYAVRYSLNHLQPEMEEIRIPVAGSREPLDLLPGAMLILFPEANSKVPEKPEQDTA